MLLKIKNNKHSKYLLLIITVILVLMILLFSYAWITPEAEGNGATPFDVTGQSLDELIFTSGTFSLNPGSHNLSDGYGNIFSETTSKATLKSSNPDVGVFAYYNVYLDISKNSYVYSTGEVKSPELILTITNPEGAIVNNIDGLNFVTIGDVSGFDVTEEMGLFKVKINQILESYDSNGKDDIWTTRLTMLNLNTNQDINQLKTLEAEIIIQTDLLSETVVLKDDILIKEGGIETITLKGVPDFSLVAETDEGMYASEDDYGTSYYYRGLMNDNWVYFGEFYWRIVRINGDGSIRLIYAGDAPSESNSAVGSGTKNILDTQVAYHTSGTYAEYTGYMHEVGVLHGIEIDSNIKKELDNWFKNNFILYEKYLSDTLFCSDRNVTSGTGIGIYASTFAGNSRIGSLTPTFMCSNKLDRFTVDDVTVGNGALTYPVALLTTDEAIFAGVKDGNASRNYLQNFDSYFMTPSHQYYYRSTSYGARNFYWYSSDVFYNSSYVTTVKDVTPVINLKANTLVTGTGDWDNPYIVRGLN